MKAALKFITQEMESMVNSLSLEIFLIKTDSKDAIIKKRSRAKSLRVSEPQKVRRL